MAALEPHQKRVVTEKVDLDKKLKALVAFQETDTFKGLPKQEQENLRFQTGAMRDYSFALASRIANWGLIDADEDTR